MVPSFSRRRHVLSTHLATMKNIVLTLPLLLVASGLIAAPGRTHDGHGASELGVTVEELANSSRQWNGAILPKYPRGQPEVKVLRITIPAGVTLPWHYHPVINAAVILKGNLELQLTDGRKKIYQEGDALIEVVNTIHSGKALGSKDVNVVVVYAGEKGVPTTVLTKP